MNEDESVILRTGDEITRKKQAGVVFVKYAIDVRTKEGRQGFNTGFSFREMIYAEIWLITELIDRVGRKKGPNYTNEVSLRNKELTATEIRYISKAYPKLKAKGFIKRISLGHYIISPDYLVPELGYYLRVVEKFNNIK